MTVNGMVALGYAKWGVKVFPCREVDSESGNAKAPYVGGGWHSASASEEQIISWWKTWPNAIVGLPCQDNSVVVIDADRHGNSDGVATLCDLFALHGFEPHSVPCISTPRDGLHCLFQRWPEMGQTKAKIVSAVDIRDNAYVIAAGSIMADCRRYSLSNGSLEQLAKAIGNRNLPEVPQWLVALMVKPATVAIPVKIMKPNDTRAGPVKRRLIGLVRRVVSAPKGERNSTLHWAACRAREIVCDGSIQIETAIALLTEAGRQAGLPVREASATVRSGVQVGYGSARNGL
ncbi:MAG TPA: bifunctional DNA primase/polymerase [Rhizomicrobium sp.]|jgi:hypothetical protein|nr:bifunctional DNA primase/polymerase [Rhizomicrobium sp.]